MKAYDERPKGPALLEELAAIPPLALPGLAVFLVSQGHAGTVSGRLGDLLDVAEKRRSRGLATEALRRRFITGRAALRSALTMLEDGRVAETDWRFGAPANGKPHIRAPKSAIRSFNLSYAEDLIAIAVSKEVEVGIDIECGHDIPREDLPWHLFSASEQRLLRAAMAGDLTPVFLRLWTLKEAIAKRTGHGFATEFSEIDTTAMPVAEGLDAVGHQGQAGDLLLHAVLTIEGKAVFLSVSTAPLGGDEDGPAG